VLRYLFEMFLLLWSYKIQLLYVTNGSQAGRLRHLVSQTGHKRDDCAIRISC